MPSPEKRKIAYLYSRYPVVSQTFCDSEMLALESQDFDLDIGSINPPTNPFRHERFNQLEADVFYPPASTVLSRLKEKAEADGTWKEQFGDLIAWHNSEYGPSFKAEIRARNALYFAELFKKRGIQHFHVHFANRATHTALFIKKWSGIPFSFTPHAQDFMVDLGSDDLLREMCREAEFVIGVSDFSCDLLRETCPESAEKISRIYNGIDMSKFPQAPISNTGPFKIVSIGRLIDFKGFNHLIAACAQLKGRQIPFELTIVGDGPLRETLEAQIAELNLTEEIKLAGVMSQEQVKAKLQNSDCFALACIVDSKGASDILPTVITEAMGCRLPIVSTRLVGVPEMVVHEKTGLLVEPGNEKELADALAILHYDRPKARAYGLYGRERSESIFELKITSDQLIEKFKSVMPEPADVRENPPILFLVDQFPVSNSANRWDRESVLEEVAYATKNHADVIEIMAATSARKIDKKNTSSVFSNWADEIEFFPDGLVLEAEWKNQSEAVEKILELRSKLGSGIDTEFFFSQARRALHLARITKKRGSARIHSLRSDNAVCAWIIHQLTGLPFSFSAEPNSEVGSNTLDKISEDAVAIDPLDLREPSSGKRLKIGTLKLKLPGKGNFPDRSEALEKWFSNL